MTDNEQEPANSDNDTSEGLDPSTDHAAVRFPPPLIFLILLVLAWIVNRIWPLDMGIPLAFAPLGIAITLFGVAVVVLIAGSFKRNSTAIEPWKPTTALITSGLYAWSRNPIYVGFCLLNIGLGIATNNLYMFLSFIPGAVLVYYIAIAREEAYLERRFGGAYLVYKQQVRRWI